MEKVYLSIPTKDDLYYRQEWMKNPKTMSYNAGYNLNLKNYNKKTGTIIKTDKEMIEWYNKWINKEPDKYFSYIYVEGIKEPIGEIYYYLENNIHSMGILIIDKYRGKGYSYLSLIELEKIAFEKNNINELSNMIPINRISAIKTFKKAGFKNTKKESIDKIFNKKIVSKQLLITKDMYFNKNKKIEVNLLFLICSNW